MASPLACDFGDFWRRLFVMHQAAFVRHSGNHTARQNVPSHWMSLARVAYVCLLAFVFPFICWGRMGQTGHSHPLPHFVCAQPVIPDGSVTSPPADRPDVDAHGPHGMAEDDQPWPAGQAVPDSLVLFLLLLVAAETTYRLYRPVRKSFSAQLFLGASQTDLQQPTPPPRPHPRSLVLSI